MSNNSDTLQAFCPKQYELAKLYLATQVTTMMGRKLEEGDWSVVYCKAKGIPDGGWSNLNIDVNHKGLGLELKVLRMALVHNKKVSSPYPLPAFFRQSYPYPTRTETGMPK